MTKIEPRILAIDLCRPAPIGMRAVAKRRILRVSEVGTEVL
jgi:hypothetical protein